ncbi:hypothetical protein Pcar_1227 [Syntrophotalea carbinolica DSM 2380]|uniref:Leucine rich repeat variant n=1 Tax=Syntrophotalea carbinolica (strain DSM 2380 / NBRC 103641 / GraBd1) TaxID=338963 RepID=Q3A581_SYNC1|nr:hypothetical protein [Syntrophotalea carbinolica]ABA88476.1 hypothetical protein Pcar_1227 [Syntrophotalea carbinolica DSM 2380]
MDSRRKAHAISPHIASRLYGALTCSSEALYGILQDPAHEVVRAALKNRALEEPHLLALLRRRDLSEDLLRAIHQMDLALNSHKVRRALVKNPHLPAPVLQALLPQLHLFELLDICFLPGASPDQKLAAERLIIQRLPTTPLGNKITLARRAPTAIAAELLKEGHAALMDPCLTNPRLQEMAIAQFLRGATASAETISSIARHPRWKARKSVRDAILKHPRTPGIWFTLWMPGMRGPEILQLSASRRLSPSQRQLVKEELRRRGLA